MNKLTPIMLGLSLAVAGSSVAAAQETATVPKVLQITREYIKAGKSGNVHDKTESAFVAALTKAKFPGYYIGLNSMSGKSRGLYLSSYDSFAEWEKLNKAVDKNPVLAAELDRDATADGELLESMDSVVYSYDESLSYRPHPDLSHARYMEISIFHVRAGHGKDWHKLAQIVKEAHAKGGTSAHWAMFEIAYGAEDGTYIALSADKSMADIDTGFSEEKKFRDALGDEGWKNFEDLFAATVDSSRSELFSINPKQSYVSPETIAADPDFWKPKPTAAPAAKPAAAEKKATP